MSESPKSTLADLRVQIDQIDKAMHDLLIERGSVIERLIEIKSRQGGGSAFRPAREASMMRAIAERHRGRLPFDAVEIHLAHHHFHFHLCAGALQRAYRHFAWRSGNARFARFHFGFTVPCVLHKSSREVMDAVAGSSGDLGMFPLDGGPRAGAWWTQLAPADSPKVIARLPFVERPDHPAGMPVFVISKPLADGAARDAVLESVTLDRWRPDFPHALRSIDAEIIGSAASGVGLALLVARPGAIAKDAVSAALSSTGAPTCGASRSALTPIDFDASTLRGRAV